MFIEYLARLRAAGRNHFTLEEITRDLAISKGSTCSGLYRLKKSGHLISPAKGLYVIVPPEHQPLGSIPPFDLIPILMEFHGVDYYVSLLSAAQFYGATHQKPARTQIITDKRIRHPLRFGHVEIECVYKTSLTDLPVDMLPVDTGYIRIARPELVVYDLLLYPIRSGGLNHISTVLSELIESVNVHRFLELVEKRKELQWIQRFGWILEQIDPMDLEKRNEIVQRMEAYLAPKKPRYTPLVPNLDSKGAKKNPKWHILENTTVESDI